MWLPLWLNHLLVSQNVQFGFHGHWAAAAILDWSSAGVLWRRPPPHYLVSQALYSAFTRWWWSHPVHFMTRVYTLGTQAWVWTNPFREPTLHSVWFEQYAILCYTCAKPSFLVIFPSPWGQESCHIFLSFPQYLHQFRSYKNLFSMRTYWIKNSFYDNTLSTPHHDTKGKSGKLFVVDLTADFLPPVGWDLWVRQRRGGSHQNTPVCKFRSNGKESEGSGSINLYPPDPALIISFFQRKSWGL